MKKRRLLALAFSVVLSGLTLVGCGETQGQQLTEDSGKGNTEVGTTTGEGKEKTTLTMMVFPSTDNYEKINQKFLEANPELAETLEFEVLLGGSGDGDVADKLRLALTSGENIPDIVRLNYTQLPEFAKAGVLTPLNDYIMVYEDQIIDAAKAIMQYDGEYYALPREVKPKIWFYRKDIFEDCGVDAAQIKTIDDYIAAGVKIREKYPQACMENYNIPTQNYDFMMMLSTTGAGFCDENGIYNLSENADVKLTFERMKKLHDSEVMSSALEWSADWTPAFDQGEIVSQLIGGWFKTDFKNFGLESQKGKWALAPWPEEIRQGSDAGGAIWVIPAASKNKELAAEVMAKMCFDEHAAKIIYDVTGVLPALKSAAGDEYYNKQNEYYASSLGEANSEAMEYLKIFPYNPASSQEIKIVVQYLDEYLQDNMTLEQALTNAQNDLKNQIGNPFE